MDFREEYKKSAEVMTPSPEAMERMTKNILEQVKAPAKKAIPFKKISYIGGAVAACAVIAVGAVKVLPMIGRTNLETAADNAVSSACVYQETAADEYEYGIFEPTDGAEAAYNEVANDADMEYVKENTDSVSEYAADSCEDTAAPSATQTQVADKFFTDMSGTENDIMEEAAAEGEVVDETEEPFHDEDASEAHAMDVLLSKEELQFEISEDTYVLFVDGIEFDYISEGEPLSDEVRTKYLTTPDGTEYQLDFYQDDYLVLIKDGEVLGGYARVIL